MSKAKFTPATDAQRTAINNFLAASEKVKNAWFWSGGGNRHTRAARAAQLSFEYKDDRFELSLIVEMSAANVYVRKNVVVDGKTTNATALKKFVAAPACPVCGKATNGVFCSDDCEDAQNLVDDLHKLELPCK